ncbi:hypothetical protein G6F35_015260 [Rhizopus arrhizus]|nr:hypothetical protein G6F35_015260 [Rhizopus arrhizus]
MQVYIIFDLLNYAKQYRKPPKKDGRAYQVPRYVEKVLNTQPGELCYMVGTIYLQMHKKPNVLNDLEDEETIVRPDTPAKYRSDQDVISLEDESGRVEITGACLSKQFLVTGMIVGILGKEVATGTFEVIDICLPGVPPQKPLTTLQGILCCKHQNM